MKHFVEPDDLFQALVVSNATATYYMRVTVRARDGTVQHYDSTPESFVGDRTTTLTFTSPTNTPRVFKAGEVVNAFIATTSTTLVRGQTYARMFAYRGSTGASGTMAPYDLLGQGYVASGHTPTLDEFTEPGPAGGQGAITRVSLAATALGAAAGEILASTPTGALWKWISGFMLYTASATVGTRAVQFRWENGSAQQFFRSGSIGLTATQVGTATTGSNQTSDTTVVLGGSASVEFPSPDRGLPAGYALRVLDISNIDTADTCSLEAQVEEWVMP